MLEASISPADRVCAVTSPGPAVDRQTVTPGRSVTVEHGAGALHDAVLAARATGCEWLWLVRPGWDVAPDALEALLAAAARGFELQDPVLFAGMPIDPHGRLDLEAAPVLRILARELAITGAQHRLVAIRTASYGSLLVHRDAVERHGAPRVAFSGAGDDLEWTGRILRDAAGYLVPTSVVRVPSRDPADRRQLMRNRVRMLRGDGWTGPERLWAAFVLSQDLVRAAADRPMAAPGLLRAVGSGVRAGA